MSGRAVAAVDLGASSGRVVVGVIDGDGVSVETVHRFPIAARAHDGHLRWPIESIFGEILDGLDRAAERFPHLESIGIDSWAVDYALLDEDGQLLGDPISHRDGRTTDAIERVHARVRPDELYAINGLQFLPFNTLYQLEAERSGPLWDRIAHVVLLPDLIAYWLTGALRTEVTNASTTGLLDASTREWSPELFSHLELPTRWWPSLQAPGTVRGTLRSSATTRGRLSGSIPVITVASHDTASAVVAMPAAGRDVAFVSSGTWSLVGLELDEPVLSAAAREANFSNEGGVGGRSRFLRNVGGLWLLEECLRDWHADGLGLDRDHLLADAASVPAGGPIVDVDATDLIAPGDMPARIHARAGSVLTPVATVRCIVESLAAGYATTISRASTLCGLAPSTVHIVGGGAQNELLCQLTADATGLPVVAGPVEATATGNVIVQAQHLGLLPGSLDDVRVGLARDSSLRRYEPH